MGSKMGGKSMDYKQGRIIVSSYEAQSNTNIIDLRTFQVLDTIDNNMRYENN